MKIKSHVGTYEVDFNLILASQINEIIGPDDFIIIDRNIANLYAHALHFIPGNNKVYLLDALEESKSFCSLEKIYEFLVRNSVRKKSRIVAIGGGVTQDISCFIASTIYRGIDWIFFPTTLLSQADSCIGSKSSINLGKFKNVIGNFYPPKEIYVISEFLSTLSESEIRSGIGEIFKVSMIDGLNSFVKLADDYGRVLAEKNVLLDYIKYALGIKKKYIEIDEFDRDIRNIFNYGHSFGHAIESASNFSIPHGIAVCIGMDIANYISYSMGLIQKDDLDLLHKGLYKNYFLNLSSMPAASDMVEALKSDKKNTVDSFTFILVDKNLSLKKLQIMNNNEFFENLRLSLEFVKHE